MPCFLTVSDLLMCYAWLYYAAYYAGLLPKLIIELHKKKVNRASVSRVVQSSSFEDWILSVVNGDHTS